MPQFSEQQHLHGMKFSDVTEIREEFFPDDMPDLHRVSEKLNPGRSGLLINIVNWKQFDYIPEVKFDICYGRSEIYIKYSVRENFFRALNTQINSKVWEDSCVEFFISPASDGIYYNIEFNAIGTCYMGSGTGRHDSKALQPEIVSLVRTLPSMGNEPVEDTEGNICWELTVAVPFRVFIHHSIRSMKGRIVHANFYKCGDKLKVPHYLTWKPVPASKPDFHRPEYFGKLKFV